MYGGDRLPKSPPTPNGLAYMQRHSPVVIEQNGSITRGGQNGLASHKCIEEITTQPAKPATARTVPQTDSDAEPQTEEDVRFLRLAYEALVATSAESNIIVDPIIQDLLARLQYVLSPHGNATKHSGSTRSNENGQLMIQKFYRDFPNISNNVFTNETDTHSDKAAASLNYEHGGNDDDDGSSNGVASLTLERMSRNFPCLGCSMLFRRSSDLKRHAKQHLSVPANICGECGKGFARRDALKRHAGTMTCRRNAERKIYHSSLDFLKKS